MFDSRNLIISNVLKEARLIPNCGCTWVAGFFFVKSRASAESPGPDLTVGAWLTVLVSKVRGYGGEILSLWSESQVRKQCKFKEFYLRAIPAKSMLWLIIMMLLAELGGSHWPVISVMVGKGEFLLFGLGCLEAEYRHLVSNPAWKITM